MNPPTPWSSELRQVVEPDLSMILPVIYQANCILFQGVHQSTFSQTSLLHRRAPPLQTQGSPPLPALRTIQPRKNSTLIQTTKIPLYTSPSLKANRPKWRLSPLPRVVHQLHQLLAFRHFPCRASSQQLRPLLLLIPSWVVMWCPHPKRCLHQRSVQVNCFKFVSMCTVYSIIILVSTSTNSKVVSEVCG